MFERNWLAAALAVLVVGSAGVAGAAVSPSEAGTAESSTGTQSTLETSGSAVAGAHVSANVTSDAVVDYRVDGTTVAESVQVQSQSEAQADTGSSVGADLGAMTNFAGAGLSTAAETETSATIAADSGAELTVHDNGHGSLVVAANDESQYVGLNLSASAEAESEGEQRVVVTQDDGTKSTVLVVGNGSVTVNEDDNVTADVAEDSRLVVRSYEDRSDDDERQEDLIQNGTAAAQVYLTQQAEGGSEAAVDVVDYGQETTVEVTQQTESQVNMTAERSAEQGKVVITSLNDTAFEASDDAQVRVDGEAAVEASSYSELAAAADGGDSSKYMVRQASSANADAEVLVALNHFSQRSVTMEEASTDDSDSSGTDETTDDNTSDGDETTAGEDGSGSTGESGPGFTGLLALVALAATAGIALRRQ